jgi:hypothetical protein
LKPASAVQWFADASPKLHRTIESPANPVSKPIRLERAIANATPTALGTCDAIVLVCGGTHMGRLPHTLWRPWLIGSSLLAHKESSVSNTGVDPASLRLRAIINPPDR